MVVIKKVVKGGKNSKKIDNPKYNIINNNNNIINTKFPLSKSPKSLPNPILSKKSQQRPKSI